MLDLLEFAFDIFFEQIIVGSLKFVGSLFRYLFLFRKYTYKQVLKQDYNGRVGFVAIVFIGIAIAIVAVSK